MNTDKKHIKKTGTNMFKYSEIVNWIIDEIASGNLPEGAKLPTEKEMMAQFGVSRQSVRRAVRQIIAVVNQLASPSNLCLSSFSL